MGNVASGKVVVEALRWLGPLQANRNDSFLVLNAANRDERIAALAHAIAPQNTSARGVAVIARSLVAKEAMERLGQLTPSADEWVSEIRKLQFAARANARENAKHGNVTTEEAPPLVVGDMNKNPQQLLDALDLRVRLRYGAPVFFTVVPLGGEPVMASVDIAGRSFSAEHLAKLGLAPKGAKVTISFDARPDAAIVNIYASHPSLSGEARSELVLTPSGSFVVVRSLDVKPGQPKGTGLRLIADQARAAQDLGFKAVVADAYADGEGTYFGPYRFATAGFDAGLPDTAVVNLGLNLQGSYRVSDLLDSPEMRQSWRNYVINTRFSLAMTLDLTPDSAGLKRLQNAVRELNGATRP